MLDGVPWLMFVIGGVIVIGGLRSGVIARLTRLPLWFCALLIGAVLIGIWLLFKTQYGGVGLGA